MKIMRHIDELNFDILNFDCSLIEVVKQTRQMLIKLREGFGGKFVFKDFTPIFFCGGGVSHRLPSGDLT